MRFFTHQSAAERYARSRPYFHPEVMRKIRDALDIRQPVHSALDVGCGTGQSTVALRELARHVIGTDISPSMLYVAAQEDAVQYAVAKAEQLPFVDEPFDLITVAAAFHWFDRTGFLAEASRLLRPEGWLVIYNNAFSGRMLENSQFAVWSRERYTPRYPSPSRDPRPLMDADAQAVGFRIQGHERYTDDVSFSLDEMVGYLMTHSNVIAAVEEGREPLETARDWLKAEMTPLFVVPQGTFQFGGPISYLQKTDSKRGVDSSIT